MRSCHAPSTATSTGQRTNGSCFLFGLAGPQATDLTPPGMGLVHTYLVTGKNPAGEGILAYDSKLQQRPNLAPCP